MSLDRFIKSVRMEVAKKHHFDTDYEIDAFLLGLEEAAKDNQEALERRDKMLRDTVAELCEAKQLLKTDFATLADVVAVVHCKDCKYREEHHYEEEREQPYIKYSCKFTKYSMPDDGYCSCGVRKKEA